MSLPATQRHKLDALPAARGLTRSARTIDAGRDARFSLASSTLFVMGATLGAALLGFVREVVNAKYYGTQWQMDTFLAASVIPTILFGIFNGALVAALVPTFSEYVGHERPEEAWRLGSTIVNLLGLIMLGCAVLGYVLAPWYVPLVAHGFPKPQVDVAICMTRLLMPSIVGVALAGVLSGILNAFRRFRAAAIVGMVLNLVTIATVIILNHRFGIFALVFGTALGLIAQFVVQIPAFLSLGGYRPVIDLHHPGLKKMLSLFGPITVGSAAEQAAVFFNRFFASTLPVGHIAGMNYASKLATFPQQIFAVAIATVIYPLLATQFAQENRKATRAKRDNRIATGELHHDTIGLRSHSARASDRTDPLPARRVRRRLCRPHCRLVAVRGRRVARNSCQHRARALPLRLPPDGLARRHHRLHRYTQRYPLDNVAADAGRSRPVARKRRQPDATDDCTAVGRGSARCTCRLARIA